MEIIIINSFYFLEASSFFVYFYNNKKTSMDRLQPGNFYHIFHRGKDRENIFREQRNYDFFYRRFLYYTKQYFEIYAYCLMSNHYHFVIRVKEIPSSDESVSSNLQAHEKAIKNFLISYSKSFNKW